MIAIGYLIFAILIALLLSPVKHKEMTVATPRYKRIGIVGGGPAGVAAYKAILSEPARFELVDLYERRDQLGGLWYYSGDKSSRRPQVPSTNPEAFDLLNGSKGEFFSPMYKYLETNLISSMMEYRDVHFPESTATFPPRQEVLRYIQQYAETVPESPNATIHYNSNVTEAKKENDVWQLTIQSNGETQTKSYDAMIVANGHFDIPFIPDVEGLKEWSMKNTDSVTHAKYFDSSAEYRNKTVLVIGDYASGTDIATQISVTAEKVYVSVKDLQSESDIDKFATRIGLITKYDYNNDRSVHTIDNERISDIDVIIFCTGYLYSIPFLHKYLPNLITDGNQVNDLYKQMFYFPDPSLSLVALPKFVIPMPIAEAQSSIIARYYSGRLELPSTAEMQTAYKQELAEKGAGKTFHNLQFPADVEYANQLLAWIVDTGLDSRGLLPPLWDEERVANRKNTKALKSKRLDKIIDHTKQLRTEGKEFELAPN